MMKNKLDIQWFIEQHSDWEKILSEKPYCLIMNRENMFGRNLIMLKYNQIDTSWAEGGNLVRECRGIILDEDTNEVVSYAFNKFFNEHEVYADKIDASSMKSTVKVDGSIIKIVRLGDNVLISTNGTINAYSANIADQIGCPYHSFGELVQSVIDKKFESVDKFKDYLKEGFTYIFELVSPFSRVVTPYPNTNLYLIGCRDNTSFKEIFFKDCELSKYFDTPDILDFGTIEQCLKYAQTLDWTNEGFVVMDKDFHRVKVKNASWLAVHHLCDNHVMSYSRALDIVKANEIDEVVSYFPEFKDALLEVKERYEKLIGSLEASWDGFMTLVTTVAPRKEAAIWIQKNFKIPGCGFSLLDHKVDTVKEWVENCPSKNILKHLGYKE